MQGPSLLSLPLAIASRSLRWGTEPLFASSTEGFPPCSGAGLTATMWAHINMLTGR